MNKEQDNQPLLVDQDDALGVYFDSLLASDEIEFLDDVQDSAVPQEPAIQEINKSDKVETVPQTVKHKPSEGEQLHSVREFLMASKHRLQQSQLSQQKVSPQISKQQVTAERRVPEKAKQPAVGKKSIPATLTAGPVSPKLREEIKPEKISSRSDEPVIVFSEKDKDGKVKEQLLIPRSQRLAQQHKRAASAQKSAVISPRKASVSATDITDSKPGEQPRQSDAQDKTSTVKDQLSESALQPSKIKEAPELDLSLFLPTIKTLSDEEIKQQLEALTQAAVSQAQMETELQQLSQYEKFKQQTQQGDSETLIKNINNAPDWAIPEFQVLLFAVSGLKLAIPLSELNGIVEWGDEYISEMPGHASWYLGLVQHLGKNVPVIDTLQQVVPKQRWPSQHLENPQFKHIILIDNAQWGLACEKVLEIITLKTDEVKWRSSRTKRRWLLGTVIDQMCALLDSAEFASMLATGEDSLIDQR